MKKPEKKIGVDTVSYLQVSNGQGMGLAGRLKFRESASEGLRVWQILSHPRKRNSGAMHFLKSVLEHRSVSFEQQFFIHMDSVGGVDAQEPPVICSVVNFA